MMSPDLFAEIDLSKAIASKFLTLTSDQKVSSAISLMSSLKTSCSLNYQFNCEEENSLIETQSSCVLIVDNNQLLGIVTEGDLINLIATKQAITNLTLSEVMNYPVVTLKKSELNHLFAVLDVFQKYQICHLPIVDEEKRLLGLLTYKSLRQLADPINLLRWHEISEVMNAQVVYAKPTTCISILNQMMAHHQVSSVVIVAESQQKEHLEPIGIITEQDLVGLFTLGLNLAKVQAQAVMNSSLISVRPNASLWSVQLLMEQKQINQVIVTNHQGNLLGIVTQSNLLKIFNPARIYRTLSKLTKQVSRLELEKLNLLKSRTVELEKQVQDRTVELQAQYQRERLLADITRQIRASLNLQEVFKTTVTTVRAWLNCDRVLLYQFDDNCFGQVVVESVSKIELSLLNLQINDPCISSWREPYTKGRISSIEDIEQSAILSCHQEMLAQFQVRANVVLPILQDSHLWGLLIAHQCDRPRHWEKSEVELLKQIADQVAIAIQQAAAYEQAQNELEERKRTEQALRESQQQLKLAFEAANMGSWNWNIQTGEIKWSDNLEALFGLLPGEFDGSYEMFVASIHHQDRDRVLKAINHSVTTGANYEIEFRIVYPDGRIRWALSKGKVFYDADGQPLQMVGIDLDISDRKKLENQLFQLNQQLERRVEERTADLQTSEARLQLAIKASGSGIWELDLTNNQVIWNDGMYQLFAVIPSPELNLQQIWENSLHPEDRTRILQDLEARLQGSQEIFNEYKIVRPNGEIRFIEASAIIQRNQQGEPERVIGINYDITERKQIEITLRQYEKIVSATNEAICLLNREYIYQAINQAYSQWHRKSSQEIIGHSVREVLGNQLFEKECKALLDRCLAGEVIYHEKWHEFPDRTKDYISLTYYPCFNEDQTVSEVVISIRNITPLKRAIKALQESERRYAALAETAPVGIFRFDLEGNCLYANNHLVEMTGRPLETLLGTGWFEAIHPEDRHIINSWNQPLEASKLSQQEGRHLLPDGRINYFFSRSLPETDLDGNVISYIGTVTDITELKKAQAAVEQSERRYATLTEISPVGIFQIDPEGNCLYVNERWCQITGINAEQAIGKGWFKAIYSEDREKVAKAWYRAVQEKKAFKLEYRFQHQDQKIVWVFGQEAATYDLEGKIIAYVGTITDISDRKEKEQIIRLQAKREFVLRSITQKIRQSLDLELIFQTVAQEIRQFLNADRVGVFQFDPKSNFEEGEFIAEAVIEPFASALKLKIRDRCFGEKYAFYYQQGRFQVINDLDQADLTDCHRQFLSQFQVRANLVIPLIQGQHLWGLICIHQCSKPRHWQNFEINFIKQIAVQLAIAIQQADLFKQIQTELNERKQAEVKLQQINQQLELSNQELSRATRLKDEFLANMSHELRTPLNTILGMSEALQEEVFGSLSDQQKHTITAIESSGKHLLELINDILDLAKIEAGKLEINLASVSVQQLCQDSLVFIKQQAIKKRIEINTNIPSNLAEIQGDRRRLRQVLINLLNNAVKFTSSLGTITLQVTIEPAPQTFEAQTDQLICFSVIDTGIGIAAENIDKLFQPFIQIDSALNRQYSGTGLGLTLVKQIIEMHHGFITVKSEINRGSCFKVCLPYHQKFTNQISLNSITKTKQASSELVLIVEESNFVSTRLLRYLKTFSIEAIVHEQGEGTIEKALAIQPKVIFLDFVLLDQSGWELLTQLKANPKTKDIPVVLIAVNDERSQALELGAFEVLVKPVTKEQLQNVLASISGFEINPITLTEIPKSPKILRQRPLILLADDNQANIETFSDYLENRGYQIILANNGQEAINLTQAQTPDLIIMDIQMPIVDGFEAIRRLRNDSQYSSIPIITLTALAMEQDREKALQMGANQFLTKPVRLQELASTIEQLLNL